MGVLSAGGSGRGRLHTQWRRGQIVPGARSDDSMDAHLIRQFLDLLTRGIIAPRATARQVIDLRLDMTQRLMLLGLAAALQGMLWAVTSMLTQGFGGGIGFGGQVRLAVQVFVNYAITATVAYHLGQRLGGRGSPQDVASAVAWHAMLTAALAPLLVFAVGTATPQAGLSGGAAFLILGYAGFNIWLLGCCIAEAHGFESAARVAAAAFGLTVAVGTVLLLVIGGLSGLG